VSESDDEAEAFWGFMTAAGRARAIAQHNLALVDENVNDDSVAKNTAGADVGTAEAHYRLGGRYKSGTGVARIILPFA
jgi:Flp pilus assembly protein TadD